MRQWGQRTFQIKTSNFIDLSRSEETAKRILLATRPKSENIPTYLPVLWTEPEQNGAENLKVWSQHAAVLLTNFKKTEGDNSKAMKCDTCLIHQPFLEEQKWISRSQITSSGKSFEEGKAEAHQEEWFLFSNIQLMFESRINTRGRALKSQR